MPAIRPLYEVRLLKYPVEQFAKTAVSNAIWLASEWLMHKRRPLNTFSPGRDYVSGASCWEEALLTLDGLPEELRHRVFMVSFMWRANTGEHLFRGLVLKHPELLREALRAEWMRRGNIPERLSESRIGVASVAKELLPWLTRLR